MKRESLEVLGITFSGDLSVGELLRISEEELLEPGISYKVAALREICEEFCETATGPTTTVLLLRGRAGATDRRGTEEGRTRRRD